MKKLFLSLILAVLMLSPVFRSHAQNYDFDALGKYYEKALVAWEVPGMAVAVVRNDSIIFAQGFGVREIGKPEKVDANTVFAIASNTKAFTSAGLAILVDEKKISWDDRVVKYLPFFELYDPWVTQKMTIRDLLCHRSGLETFSGDLLWYGTNYTREEVVRRAKSLKPKYDFRTHFGYSNIMFLAAGMIIEKVSGMSWDQFMAEKIFKPCGMKRSITSVKQLSGIDNVAQPHTAFEGKIISIPFLSWDNIAPAGSIISSVNDVAQWLRLQLNKGKINGNEVFSEKQGWEMWTAHTPTAVSSRSASTFPSTHFKSYALGWDTYDYHGRKIVTHNGGYDGMISQTVLIPEDNLGFVILTNCNSSMFYPLCYKTLDFLLKPGEEGRDWSAAFLPIVQANKKSQADEQKEEDERRVKNTKPSLALSDYAGKYSGEVYGSATVVLKDGKLIMTLDPAPLFSATIEHWHYDTFSFYFKNFPSLPRGMVSFTLTKAGKVDEMKIDLPNPDFDFTELDFKKE
jgi:CubicO group peptidase (beta-lactamase class C family)